MGMDILLVCDVEDLEEKLYEINPDYNNKFHLSKSFCNFIERRQVVTNPELSQIGEMLDVDISPYYEMADYGYLIGYFEDDDFESEEVRLRFKKDLDRQSEKINCNIDSILNLTNNILEKLKNIEDLPSKIEEDKFTPLGDKSYFDNFEKDLGNGFIDNNLGQDLRNLKRTITFYKSNNAKTVYFLYEI